MKKIRRYLEYRLWRSTMSVSNDHGLVYKKIMQLAVIIEEYFPFLAGKLGNFAKLFVRLGPPPYTVDTKSPRHIVKGVTYSISTETFNPLVQSLKFTREQTKRKDAAVKSLKQKMGDHGFKD